MSSKFMIGFHGRDLSETKSYEETRVSVTINYSQLIFSSAADDHNGILFNKHQVKYLH